MTHTTLGFTLVDFSLGLVSALVGCIAAVVLPDQPNGWVALIVATTGMITALGAVTTALVRIWAEHRRNDREELWRRHELDQRLETLARRIGALELSIDRLLRQIESRSKTHCPEGAQ